MANAPEHFAEEPHGFPIGRPPEPSLYDALQNVLQKTQRVVVERVALLRLEAQEDLYAAVRAASLLTAGIILVFYGWLFAIALVVYFLQKPLPLSASIAIVGGLHIAIGIGLALGGLQRLRRIRVLQPDKPPEAS
jgi:hypothetical protein